jgi:DNA-directed RNA polymerase specialized sigma24 family protein
VFLLKLVGYSTREIALRIKRSPTTVDSLHSRSPARLRACARRGGRTDQRISS